jgi:SAM-dependent methyltransferase
MPSVSPQGSARPEAAGSPASRPGRRCIVCGSAGPFLPTLEILVRCPQCDLVFADPQLTYEEVLRLYSSNYFMGEEYVDYLGDKVAIQRSFRRKVAHMAQEAPAIRRVYEIGAAYGFFLELAQERWEAAGIDIAQEAVSHARNVLRLDVQHGDFLTAAIVPGYYDTFCMWDTIEHLARPEAYIERAAALIAPGGYIFISTGDIASAMARRQGRSWRLIHPPTHLFYFSGATLRRLLGRFGFRVQSVTSMGVHRSLRQTVYSLFVQRRPQLRPLYDRFAATSLGALSYYLNLGDIMLVTAQAPSASSRSSSSSSDNASNGRSTKRAGQPSDESGSRQISDAQDNAREY